MDSESIAAQDWIALDYVPKEMLQDTYWKLLRLFALHVCHSPFGSLFWRDFPDICTKLHELVNVWAQDRDVILAGLQQDWEASFAFNRFFISADSFLKLCMCFFRLSHTQLQISLKMRRLEPCLWRSCHGMFYLPLLAIQWRKYKLFVIINERP